jgi:bifunctional non-homologous end joining protein LigD
LKLKTYQRKRDFNKTPEPCANTTRGKKITPLYVIQKHDARHLHYDFRLEIQGVLKSWAVPKGPSKDPAIKRLAIEVEDHPLAYGKFSGRIPKGQYGAGTVEIWDTGTWKSVTPVIKAYEKGDLTFELFGKKLKGLWKLIRIKSEKQPQWLLMKVNEKSLVKTRIKTLAPATFIKPQLATLVQSVPTTKDWLYEVKYDGYRIIAVIAAGTVKLFTRNKNDWTHKLPSIANELKKITVDCVLDGELVVLEKGISKFELLQNEIGNQNSKKLQYKVFDMMYVDGENIMPLALMDRKNLLDQLFKSFKSARVTQTEYIVGKGAQVFENACKMNLEGIIAKKIDGVYQSRRTKNWLKLKCTHEEEYIIIGFTQPQGTRKFFGSLLLGYYKNKQLIYAGHVGTGFNEKTLADIFVKMKRLIVLESELTHMPQELKNESITWLKPKLVAQIKYIEKTQKGILRTASFLGLRLDKTAPEVKQEIAKTMTTVVLTHPDIPIKITGGITKEEIAAYYTHISDRILPYLKDRPLSLLRCPSTGDGCFFQKHFTTSDMKTLKKTVIKEKHNTAPYIMATKKSDLLHLVQAGVIEIHPWGSKKDKIELPDRITFDLDPAPNVPWSKVVSGAFYVRDFLTDLGLKCFVKTTGGKGLHIVVPIIRKHSWDDIKLYCKAIAVQLAKMQPDLFIAVMSKEKRIGKIFIDYLRNSRGATAVAPYSLRAHKDAPISTPLTWAELKNIKSSAQFNILNINQRLEKLTSDPWADFFKCRQQIRYK